MSGERNSGSKRDRSKRNNKPVHESNRLTKPTKNVRIHKNNDIRSRKSTKNTPQLTVVSEHCENEELAPQFATPGYHQAPENLLNEVVVHEKENDNAYNEFTWEHTFFEKVNCHEFLIFPKNQNYRVIKKIGRHKVVVKLIDSRLYKKFVKPKNLAQRLFLDLLLANPDDLPAVAGAGQTGSGKTYLTIVAINILVNIEKSIDRVVFVAPLVEKKHDMGFYTGTEAEKMSTLLRGLTDNMGNFSSSQGKNPKLKKLPVQMCSIDNMGGRSLKRTVLVIDEGHNLDVEDLRLLITRTGEGSKLIILGDSEQIRQPGLTQNTCGISLFISKFADCAITGHVTMPKGVRSEIANEAVKRLS